MFSVWTALHSPLCLGNFYSSFKIHCEFSGVLTFSYIAQMELISNFTTPFSFFCVSVPCSCSVMALKAWSFNYLLICLIQPLDSEGAELHLIHLLISQGFVHFLVGVQFSSVAPLCLILCNPMDCSTPVFPVYHQLLELTQTQALCFLFVFFPFIFISWRLITSQHCSGFCHTVT